LFVIFQPLFSEYIPDKYYQIRHINDNSISEFVVEPSFHDISWHQLF
jgi:hypothetical protein